MKLRSLGNLSLLARTAFLCLLIGIWMSANLVDATEVSEVFDESHAAVFSHKAKQGKSQRADTGSVVDGQKEKSSHKKILEGAQFISGVIPLYRKDGKLYAELGSRELSHEYIVLLSIARGMGSHPLLGGMSWGFGDDWIWKFRKVDKRIQIIRRNVRFRAGKGTPESKAVEHAYNDSVLFSLPIATQGPKGGDLVDLTKVFMSDLPQISRIHRDFVFSSDRSTWVSTKGFKRNIELRVAATYSSSGKDDLESVADSRGVTIHVHYSISRLDSDGYQPRLADDRVGYFVTASKDYSKKSGEDQFVRYINRWDLRKADPKAEHSPPVKPIVFWIENTVPYEYRQAVREGILEWNRAFQKAGFADAIEVRQQPKDATWDPEDVNYNTFRWMTSNAGFAMGPSRVNPYSGQILDADIVFDADFVRRWNSQFETLTSENVAVLTGGPLNLEKIYNSRHDNQAHGSGCVCAKGLSQQLALADAVLEVESDPKREEMRRKCLVLQGLKHVVMHEVGHTLGLRHNFKGSTFRNQQQLHDSDVTGETGLSASVMDYLPTNIAPRNVEQGDYFPTTLGPYDVWAIEYGYLTGDGGTTSEKEMLLKIASRSGESGLSYATDEDARGVDPDPHVNRYDLGDDTIAFSKQRAQIFRDLIPEIVERLTEEGEDYSQARRGFNILLATYGQAMHLASRYVGGVYISRSHRGDPAEKNPSTIVDPDKQREALRFLGEEIFSTEAFQLPRKLYTQLGSSHWQHWGADVPQRSDFPVQETILLWQNRVLDQLLSSTTLQRISDSELKVPADQDAMTVAELLQSLTEIIYSELDFLEPNVFTNRLPAIGNLRRNLQKSYLKRLSSLALTPADTPRDCAALVDTELSSLETKIQTLLNNDDLNLDNYSQSHLRWLKNRIRKVLDATTTVDFG